MIYILILTLYAGPLSNGDSVALTTAEFANQANCEIAGKRALSLTAGSVKVARYICVQK
jgi:hypothetical protein